MNPVIRTDNVLQPGDTPDGDHHHGAASQQNWAAFTAGRKFHAAFEVELYSDAKFVGDIPELPGPYSLRWPVSGTSEAGSPRHVFTVRIDDHRDSSPFARRPWSPAIRDSRAYHGGDIDDEIAALLSLRLGVRMMAGRWTRVFHPDRDPAGEPPPEWLTPEPAFFPRPRSVSKLPSTMRSVSLSETRFVSAFGLDPTDCISLIQAARLYQQALWIADADANLSWLLLVSALERGATRSWGRTSPDRLVSLREAEPELVEELLMVGGEDHALRIAKMIGDRFQATKKFRDFVLKFCPGSPDQRPPEVGYQFSFEYSNLKAALGKIYKHRSLALHQGIPFPFPMCEAPYCPLGWDTPAETVVGEATEALGGRWERGETPMNLHAFEYIVRSTLNGWWDFVATRTAEGAK